MGRQNPGPVRGTIAAVAAILGILLSGASPAPQASPAPTSPPSAPKPPYLAPAPGLPPPQAAPAALPRAPEVEAPSSVKPGEALAVLVSCPGRLDGGSIEARRTEGEFRRTGGGMEVAVGGDSGPWGILFLLPLPMDLKPGTLSLVLAWREGGSPGGRALSIPIEKRSWASEDIALSPSLTAIKASPDPEKDRESDVLSGILLSRSPGECLLDGGIGPSIRERYRTAYFGDRRRYLYSGGGLSSVSVHWGIDLREDTGYPVSSSAAGVVAFAGKRVLTGNSVVVRHADGFFSLYYHMDSLSVVRGQAVSRGQELGRLGMTGLATGPHLHWEFRLLGEAVDPDGLVACRLLDKIRPASTIQSP